MVCVRYVHVVPGIFPPHRIELIKNEYFSFKSVLLVKILRAHGLETKETWTGPTAVGATIVYDTYCYCCTFGVRLVLLTRYDIKIECIIHSSGYET